MVQTLPLKESESLKCEFCTKIFSEKKSLRRHIATIHEGKMPFNCKYCNKNFIQNVQLDNHIALVHEGKEPFKCKICEGNLMSTHISTIHEGKMAFKCKFCNKKFFRKNNLIQRIIEIHKGK